MDGLQSWEDWERLSETEWDMMTGEFDSMTKEEILDFFQGEDEDVVENLIDSMDEEDWEGLTDAEWSALLNLMSVNDFKMLLNQMETEEILELFSNLDNDFVDDFLASLTPKDWQQATDAEWEAMR